MHEASIALAVVDELCERAERENIERIASVYLRIGALTSVVPDALQFAWEAAIEGTVASGSTLIIEHVPLAIMCSTCACERTIESSVLPVCPVCGASSTQIVGGRELLVAAMEVFYAAPAGRHPSEYTSQERYAGR